MRPSSLQLEAAEEQVTFSRGYGAFCMGTAAAVVLMVAFRAILFPLSGFDTYFRWEGLARAILQEQSLAFYPPVSAEDFALYVFPDGIPPLVSVVYWWLYAAVGRPLPEVTVLPIVLQLVSTLALVYYGAKSLFGRAAACFSVLVCATSTIFVSGFAIGQETGFTALSVAGQLCFALFAVRHPKARLVVVAALFAVLGALAREYGPSLALAGVAVLAWYPQTRRFLPLFIVVTILGSAPWYLRSWLLTGNPLYPHAVPGGLPNNGVYVAIIEYYKEYRSVGRLDAGQWIGLLGLLGGGAPMAFLVGLPAGISQWRKTLPLLITATWVVLLWLYSIGSTAGGIVYSQRVLTPAIVALAICAGAGANLLVKSKSWRSVPLRVVAFIAMACLAVFATLSAAAHPFPVRSIASAVFSRGSDPPEFCVVQPELAKGLLASGLPPTGVLTDDMYLALILQRNTPFRPVMVWSPEVSFIYDAHLGPEEVRRRLRERNIQVVAIDNDSPNTAFLTRYPFFQDYRRWDLLYAVGERGAMFML